MFLPDSIDFAESKKYILSIRLLPNGFYFSINCPTQKSVFYQNTINFKSNSTYLKNVEKIIFNYSFFSYTFNQIHVISVDNQTTTVPDVLFTKQLESELYSFNWLNPKSQLINNDIKEYDCKMIWSLDSSIYSFLSRSLLSPKFTSHLSLLVPFFNKYRNNDRANLFVNFNDDKMIDIVCFSNNKLSLAKTFSVDNSLEGCYYIQKVWEMLHLNAQSDLLFFSGNTESYIDCMETMKKIAPNSKELAIEQTNNINFNHKDIPTEILSQL